MGQPSPIRLGGVELNYDPRTGLSLKDAHNPGTRIVIYEPDLSALVEFVETARRDAIPKPHWELPHQKPSPPESLKTDEPICGQPTEEQSLRSGLNRR